MYPLRLSLLVLPTPPPPIHPLLLLLVPHFLVAAFFLDAFRGCEAFPFSRWFGFREGFGAGERRRWRGELSEGAVRGGFGGESVEGSDQGLYAVACSRLEVLFEVCAVFEIKVVK